MSKSEMKENSIEEILKLIRLTKPDLENINPDLAQEMFIDLTVGEISQLCTTSRNFNTICKRESLWETKVWNDYGIEKKHGHTWRETAKNLFILNMINLGKKWIDGRTYKEILDEALKHDKPILYMEKLRSDAMEQIFGGGNCFMDVGPFYDDESFVEIAQMDDVSYDKENEIVEKTVLTIEFGVISTTITVFQKQSGFLPASYSVSPLLKGSLSKEKSDILHNIFDYVPYVMQFSELARTDDGKSVMMEMYWDEYSSAQKERNEIEYEF